MKRKIILGLTGSVATVLYEKLIKGLQELGEVDVIVTESARHFINENRIRELVGNLNFWTDEHEWTWDDEMGGLTHFWKKDDSVLHIQLRDRGSALVLAPCSANTMGKMASGVCDNLLTSVARAWDASRPVIIAPAMNTHMWNHPVTEQNINMLCSWGYAIVDPQYKMLACGTKGMGALAEIDKIVEATRNALVWSLPMNREDFSGIPLPDHPGAFSTQRKHEKHTGVDLYADENTIVTAVESGVVVGIEHFTGEWDNTPWWNNTDCVLVEGATGVVCYGEVYVPSWITVGKRIERGTYVANVKRVLKDGKERTDIPGHKTSMLHLELYPHGTTKASHGFESHLQDPTPFLIEADPDVPYLTYSGKDKHACVVHAPRADDLQEGFTPQ